MCFGPIITKRRAGPTPTRTVTCSSPLDGLLSSEEDNDDDCKPKIIDPDPCYIHGYPPDLLLLLTTTLHSQNMSTTGDEPSLNGRLRPRKSISRRQTHNTSRKSDNKPKKTHSPSIDPPKTSALTNEPPKASAPAKELPKASVPAKEPPKTSVLSTEPPKTNDDLANKTNFSSTNQFLCSYCDKIFGSKKNVTKHVHRAHSMSPKQVTFVCLFCDHSELDTTTIISHMKDNHPNQYFACLDCQTRFPSTSELAEHRLLICKKLKTNKKKLRKKDPAGGKAGKKTKKSQEPKEEVDNASKEFQDGPSFNGIVISCELKSTQVHDNADIEDHISTNFILPPSKSLAETSGLDKGAVIVLDDVQWNKRIPPNFSFHNTDADQILSRLGVVHRSPRTGESSRRDFMKNIDNFPVKFEKCFETSFYSKVASNVQENLSKFLDGTFNFNPDPDKAIKTRKAKNSVVINTAEGFPILLASEQFTRSAFDCYMPRAIAPKHKWKWDNLDSEKTVLSVDQIKRDNHTNNCIITLVSSLDIWTQLCMRRKFEGKFGAKPVEKKTEKRMIIGNELKEILESREITSSSSQGVKWSAPPEVSAPLDDPSFPLSLGLRPRTAAMSPTPAPPPAVLSGECVRPRCYVCCACGDQTRDGRTLSLHISTHHPNALVHHQEIVGEQLLNADILKHLYVPPSQVANRTRPLRGIKECTKCQKPISMEELHQHMLDCAGDTPAVRRRQPRSRPFGVRRRRPRLPDNTLRTRIRKGIRSKQRRQKKLIISRPKIRTEVGDGETIRKMLADLPAKRHRALVNPPHKMARPRRMVNHQMNKLMMKRRVGDQLSSGHRRPASRADKTSTAAASPHRTKPKTNYSSSGKEDEDNEDNKPLKPKKHRLNNLRTRRIDIARKVALTKAKRRSLRVIQKTAINNDVPEPPTKPDVDNNKGDKKKEEEETTSNIQEPPAAPTPQKNETIRGGYNTRQTANSGDSYSNHSRQPSGYNTRHQSGGNEGLPNNNYQRQDPGGGGYNTRQNSGYGDDYSHNSRSGGYNNRRSGVGSDHPHNMTHEYGRGGYNTRERANRSGSSNSESRDERPPPAPGPPAGPARPERVAPLAPPGIPLKHSIARLTANSETHDKALQFTHCFLMQQEYNNTDEHAPSGRQPQFESKAMTQKLDKPPIDKSLLDLCALQKNKLNKPKKGLNDCIAMLKNKLVEPMPTGHVSVQCGPDEPISPMHLTSLIIPSSKEAMISPKPDHRDKEKPSSKETETVYINAQNEQFDIPNKAEIQAQVQLSFPPPRRRPPKASAVQTRRHSTEQELRNSSRQSSPWDNVPKSDISLARRRTNSSDERTTPTRESKPPARRVSVSMTDPMYQSKVGEYHPDLQLILPKSIQVNKVKPPGSRTCSSTRSRRQSDAVDYNYRKPVIDFNWQGSYQSRAFSDRSENISLTHNQYVQAVETMPPMHTSAYGHRLEKMTAMHHLPYEEEYEKVQAMQNIHIEQTLIKISPSRNVTYDQTTDKITPMHNLSYGRMYDKIPVTQDPSYDQTIEKVSEMRDYLCASRKYAEAESVQNQRINEDRNIYPDDHSPAIIPSVHASTNVDSVIPAPLDLSGRMTDVPREMPYAYDNYETLDLSRKGTKRYDAPMIDDVVDLRVRTYSDNEEYDYYGPSTTTMLDPEAANDLSLRGDRFQNLPTDLSLKYREKTDSVDSLRHKRDDVDFEVMSSQKRMKTRSENLLTPSGNLLIGSGHTDTDIIRKLNENKNVQQSLQMITDQSSYSPKTKNIDDPALSTKNLHTYQKVPKHAANVQPGFEHATKCTDFSNIGLTQQTVEVKTIPKRRPSCTVTSQSLAQAAQKALYANPNATCANPTIANLESFHALITHNKVPENAVSINTANIYETVFGSSDICNRRTPNITMEEKSSNKATAVDQDTETAKKIAMLPRELVEILGTMPVDHRNQLLNFLPQYVATTMASPLSLPNTGETQTYAVIRSKLDNNEHDAMPITPLKIKASRSSRQSCETIICDKISNTVLTPSSPVPSEMQFDTTSVKLTNTGNITISPMRQTICEPNKNCTTLVTDPTIHQHDIQCTIDDNKSEHCNEVTKVATLSITMPLPEPILVKVDKLLRPSNEQTASLRAVRIRAQTDRQKDNQPVKEIPTEELSKSKITEEIPKSIPIEDIPKSILTTTNEISKSNLTEESKPDLPLETRLFLAVQQADISSTQHANKNRVDLDIQTLPTASMSQIAVENTNNKQPIFTKDGEIITQPSPTVCVEDKKLTETMLDQDSANNEPNNVPLTHQEDSNVIIFLEKNPTSSDGELPNFNNIVPGSLLENKSYMDKKDYIKSIDWSQHEKTVEEADSEDDVSLASIVKLKQRAIQKKSKISVSRNSKKGIKRKFTKHHQLNKKCKATKSDKATLFKDTEKADDFEENLEIDMGSPKNLRSEDDFNIETAGTSKPEKDSDQSALVSLSILKPTSGEDLTPGFLRKSINRKKNRKSTKRVSKINDEDTKNIIQNESKSEENLNNLTSGGDVMTVNSLNCEELRSGSKKESLRGETLIRKDINSGSLTILKPCVTVALQTNKDVTFDSDKSLQTTVESVDPPIDKAIAIDSDKILKTSVEYVDPPTNKVKTPKSSVEFVSSLTNKEISFSIDKNDKEKESITTVYTSMITAPSIVEDIDYAAVPLRRSRRGKSVFTDSNLNSDYKPPVTKKQLIFSKLLLDEENHQKITEQVTEPVNKEEPTVDNNSGCTSEQKNSNESFNTSNKNVYTLIVSKSLKRKKTPQNKESKKKKSLDASSVPQNVSKVTKNQTENDIPNAKNSNNDDSPASGPHNSQVAERDGIVTIDDKKSSSLEKRKQPTDDTVDSETKKLKLTVKVQEDDLKTSKLNKTIQEELDKTHKLPCYSVQIASRRTRSKSVNVKLSDKYDPYDIDLDDMIDYEPLRKSFKSHHSKSSKLKSNNLDLNLPGTASFNKEKLAYASGSVTVQNEEISNQSHSVTIDNEKIACEPTEEKDINVFAKNSKCNKSKKNIDSASMKDKPTFILNSTQDHQDGIQEKYEKHSEKENIDSDDSLKSDVPLVKYIEEKEKKQLVASVSNNTEEDKSNELKKCNKYKAMKPLEVSNKDCQEVCVLPSTKSKDKRKSLAKRQNIKKKQKKALTSSSNNTDDEKSDVPLQKLFEDKKRQQKVALTLKTIDDEKNHIPLKILTKDKKRKLAAKSKGKAPVVGSCKIKKSLMKNIQKPVQHVQSIPVPLKSDEIGSKNETDEQLRSEKFMESFGFFSERKPRKSNLIAARKIAETFHNANESDAMFLKRISRDSNPIENKVPTKKSQLKSLTVKKKSVQKILEEGTVKPRRPYCRPCRKRFSRPDSLIRHRLTYPHVSKVSQFQMKFRTRPAPEEPNFLVALKQQAKRFNVLLDPTKNKDNKQAKMPSLHNIVSEAFRDVREQKLSQIGFTREEALFIDCCELLNSSEIAKLMEEVPHPNPNRMCLGKCNSPPKLKVKRKSKKRCKRDEITAKKKARKKKNKIVMNVEKEFKTGIKDSSILGPSKRSLQRVETSVKAIESSPKPGPSHQKTERVAIYKCTESNIRHGLSKIASRKIQTITSDKGAESPPVLEPSKNSCQKPETCMDKRSEPQPKAGTSRSLIPKTETIGSDKGKNTQLKSEGSKKSNKKNILITSSGIQLKPGPSNNTIPEVTTDDKSTESLKPGSFKKSNTKIKTVTGEKCSKTLESELSKNSRGKTKKVNHKNEPKSGALRNSRGTTKKVNHNNQPKSSALKILHEKAISELTSDICTENQTKPFENLSKKNITTITSEKSEYQSKPGASSNKRIETIASDKLTANQKLGQFKKIFKKSATVSGEKSVEIQPKPGWSSKTTHQDTENNTNAKSTESQQKPSENASLESKTETLPSDNDKCTVHKKERRSKKTEIVAESQPRPVPSKNSTNSSETPTGDKCTGNQLKSSPTKNSRLKSETVNIDKSPNTQPKYIPATDDKVTESVSKLGSSKFVSKQLLRTETATSDDYPESQLKSDPSKNSRQAKGTETTQGADISKNAQSQNIETDIRESQLKPVSSKKLCKKITANNDKGTEKQQKPVSFKNSRQKTETFASSKCDQSQPEEPGSSKKSRQRIETVKSAISEDLAQETSKDNSASSNTVTKENENQKFKIKEFMYPEETVDLFEDKFDKIKRKCRSQAAAAKQSIPVVESITGQKSETEESKTKKKKSEKKAKKSSKKGNKAVLTKGALKGFDEVKMSIATSEVDASTAEPSLECSTKKRKKSLKKKKLKKLSELSRKYESDESTKPQKKLDVYEFFDEETELLELRPSTLMGRFKNITKKETSSTSKQSKETASTAKQLNETSSTSKKSKETTSAVKQLKETSSTSKQLLQVSQDQEANDSSDSMSDGDDFVYMSDDYVASDDETENSLISEIGIVKGDGKKAVSLQKKKEVTTEKNAVMGKIFKHNALRAEKIEIKSDVTEKPQANLDQLFDSLLKDIPTEETVPHQKDNPSPKVSSRSPSLSPSIESLTEPTTRCLSPDIYEHATPKKEIKPRLVASTTIKSASVYDFDCVPSTSKNRDDFDLSDDFNTGWPIDTGTFGKEKRDTTFTKTYSSDDDDDDANVFLASGSLSRKSSVFERTETYIAERDLTVEDAGVARQRARRKCTVGKQNVLAESWSSESEPEGGPVRPNSTDTVVTGSNRKKKGRRLGQSGIKRRHKQVSGKKQETNRVAYSSRSTSTSGAGVSGVSVTMPVVDKADVYDWDMEQEAEEQAQAQREREQHGWIVGGSHKKLVTMLAHAKGRRRNHDTHLLD